MLGGGDRRISEPSTVVKITNQPTLTNQVIYRIYWYSSCFRISSNKKVWHVKSPQSFAYYIYYIYISQLIKDSFHFHCPFSTLVLDLPWNFASRISGSSKNIIWNGSWRKISTVITIQKTWGKMRIFEIIDHLKYSHIAIKKLSYSPSKTSTCPKKITNFGRLFLCCIS